MFWAPQRAAMLGGGIAVAFLMLVVLVAQFDARSVLLGSLVPLGLLALLLRPELATLLTVFLLYINVPGILVTRYGVPSSIAGSFVLLLGIPLLHALVGRREALRLDRTFVLMLGYLATILLSALVATDPMVALDFGAKFALQGLLVYVLLVNVIRTPATLMRVIWTVLLAGGLVGTLAVYQELTGNFRQEFAGLAPRNFEYGELRRLDSEDAATRELLQQYAETHGRSGRVQRALGPVGDPNRLGQMLLVVLPLALLCYRRARNAAGRALVVVVAIGAGFGMVLSSSRGAIVTLLLLTAVAAAIRWVSPRLVVAGLVAGILLLPVAAPDFVERMSSLGDVTSLGEGLESDADGALKGRAAAMTAAARVYRDHPILGVGAGNFQPFYSIEYQQNDPRIRFREPRPYYAHSFYLQLGAELGTVGLVAFLAIVMLQLRALDRARRSWRYRRPDLADLVSALGFTLLAYLGTALFLSIAYQRYLWLFVALASAALHLLRAEERALTGAERPV